MNTFKNHLFLLFFLALCAPSFAQPIPVGDTSILYTTEQGVQFWLNFRKPATYNNNSPLIIKFLGWHSDVAAIADRKNALVLQMGSFPYAIDNDTIGRDWWLPYQMKQVYRFLLAREGRTSIPTYLCGFSAGGQTVTRYMLARAAFPDSIPIVNAISINPYYYTWPSDSIFGTAQEYPCGLHEDGMAFYGDGAIERYYASKYVVMIGTADTAPTGICGQGQHRYETAQNFFNFAQADAQARNVPFNWEYVEAPGYGHTSYIYAYKVNSTDTTTLFEDVMFAHTSPPVLPQFPPVADFSWRVQAQQGSNYGHPRCRFTNTDFWITLDDLAGENYLMDWGDGYVQQLIPEYDFPFGYTKMFHHNYATAGIYTLRCIAWNDVGADTSEVTLGFCDGDYFTSPHGVDARDTLVYFSNPAVTFFDSVAWGSCYDSNPVFEIDFGDGTTGTFPFGDSILHTYPAVADTYSVTINRAYSGSPTCIAPDTAFHQQWIVVQDDPPTSLNDEWTASGITIAPNPASGNTKVISTSSGTMRLNDLTGKLLAQIEFESATEIQLDFGSLGVSAGLYFLQWHGNDGLREVKRLVIQ